MSLDGPTMGITAGRRGCTCGSPDDAHCHTTTSALAIPANTQRMVRRKRKTPPSPPHTCCKHRSGVLIDEGSFTGVRASAVDAGGGRFGADSLAERLRPPVLRSSPISALSFFAAKRSRLARPSSFTTAVSGELLAAREHFPGNSAPLDGCSEDSGGSKRQE